MDWQPIETAPRDGYPFLGLSGWSISTYRIVEKDDETRIERKGVWPFRRDVVTVKQGGLFIENIADGGNVTVVLHGRFGAPVTHWMPLPAPPEVET